jgi:hypothetical protein
MVSVPIEVPDDRRRRPNSLTQYESDVWKIMGNMARCGFGDVYYEAVDWHEDADGKSGSTDQERPFQSLQHETTKRWAILEDNGTSAWLYITEPATFRLHSLRSTKSRATVERLRLRALMGIHGTRRGLWRPFGRWKEP